MQLVPRPSSFLYFMSLKTGAELICIFTVFNKASGLYGLLALLTGAHISAWQMSMYLYSVLAAAAFSYSLRHIKTGSASVLEVVGFAWLYLIDTLINLGYTALFATTWFLVLSQQGAGSVIDSMNSTAGFTSPTHTVASVKVIPTQKADGTLSTAFDTVPAAVAAGLGGTVLHPEQYPSIAALVAILLIKIYFCLVVMSYARKLSAEAAGSGIAPYSGWRQKTYQWMTKGSYWPNGEDLRLRKTRSSRRSDEARR